MWQDCYGRPLWSNWCARACARPSDADDDAFDVAETAGADADLAFSGEDEEDEDGVGGLDDIFAERDELRELLAEKVEMMEAEERRKQAKSTTKGRKSRAAQVS